MTLSPVTGRGRYIADDRAEYIGRRLTEPCHV
jgi:hypothetical protein